MGKFSNTMGKHAPESGDIGGIDDLKAAAILALEDWAVFSAYNKQLEAKKDKITNQRHQATVKHQAMRKANSAYARYMYLNSKSPRGGSPLPTSLLQASDNEALALQAKVAKLDLEYDQAEEELKKLEDAFRVFHSRGPPSVTRRLATDPAFASDAGLSFLWAPLLCFLAYVVWRRLSAPPRPKDHGTYVKHGTRLVPAWRQAHEDSDPYDSHRLRV